MILSQWHGLVGYTDGLDLQKQTWEQSSQDQKTRILGLEHQPVITLGKRGHAVADIKASTQTLIEKEYTIQEIDRGGHATLHNPGQLVIYPIVPLKYEGLTVKVFIEKLQLTSRIFLEKYNVKVNPDGEEPGLFTQFGKIIFVGIRVDRGITRHGISINVHNNLDDFQLIKSCGKDSETFDRLGEYTAFSTQVLFKQWVGIFYEELSGSLSSL